jgi:peptidoglycan/LPS O-acetylase OafA/YrhL
MWSLCTEAAFYVLLPALVLVLVRESARRGWSPGRVILGLAALSVAGLVWQAVAASSSDVVGQHYHQWLPGFMPWFAVGMTFAVVSVHAPTRSSTSRWHWFERAGEDLPGCWLVAAAVFTVACTPAAGPRLLITPSPDEALVKSLLYTVSATFFVLPLVFGPESAGVVRRAASSRVAVWLGDVSYGIFCLHLLALEASMSLLSIEEFTGHFGLVFATTVALTLVMAALCYHLLERPILGLKNSGPFAPRAAVARPSATRARD